MMKEKIVDFHIHSHYSRATSKMLTPEYIEYWAKIKGLHVVASGDISHPKWLQELELKLEPAEDGLFKLKDAFRLNEPVFSEHEVRFILSGELSNIYKRGDKVRKLHNVVLMPDFKTAHRFQKELSKRGFNILSDGRPILGWDARNLLELTLDINSDNFFIPAHIWTPWFSALGSKSGFDSINEAFGDLADQIFALETGLSSSPAMNWMCSFLDNFRLLSNSDAHSPDRLGRNANIFSCNLSYYNLLNALKAENSPNFIGTIDMFPQEGKYHFDGHRKCGVSFSPVESLEHEELCPVCGKKVTLGVSYRVASLADRSNLNLRPNRKPFFSTISLPEILSELHGVGEKSKTIRKKYFDLLSKFGTEFKLLRYAEISEIESKAGSLLAEAIRRMRKNEVIINEGFDGQYGQIKLFEKQELKNWGGQTFFFTENKHKKPVYDEQFLHFDIKRFNELKLTLSKQNSQSEIATITGLNASQKKAVYLDYKNVEVVAGAGTGKTKVLTNRVVYLLNRVGVEPEKILVISFTNKAAKELKERITDLHPVKSEKIPFISTFHAFGYSLISENYESFGFTSKVHLISDLERRFIFKHLQFPDKKFASLNKLFSNLKNLKMPEIGEEQTFYETYSSFLQNNNLLDTDDLLFLIYKKLKNDDDFRRQLQELFDYIFVDEFQDTNLVQYEILKLLKTGKNHFFVIGDPFQSIYAFRGSLSNSFELFAQDFKAKIMSLSISYRCSEQILSTAESLFDRKPKIRALRYGENLVLTEYATVKAEAEGIARKIEQMLGGLRHFSIDSSVALGQSRKEIRDLGDFAVLCRSKMQFPAIMQAFENHSIPYEVIEKNNEYEHIFQSFELIVKILENVSKPYFQRIAAHLRLKSAYWVKFMYLHKKGNFQKFSDYFLSILPEYSDKFEWYFKQKLTPFSTFSELENIRFGNYDFEFSTNKVRLLTIHAAKGLEFNSVFIAGLNQGVFPFGFGRKIDNFEEEKRLFYVALTRAKFYADLSYYKSAVASRFLSLMNEKFISKEKSDFRKKHDDGEQLSLF